MEATTRNFFLVTDIMVGEWVEIPAPLLGQRLIHYFRADQHHQKIFTLKENRICHLGGRVTFHIQKLEAKKN